MIIAHNNNVSNERGIYISHNLVIFLSVVNHHMISPDDVSCDDKQIVHNEHSNIAYRPKTQC